MSYQCPLCHQPLHHQQHQWRCQNNHQFDQAKEGYVNLMPVHHKSSKNPGDNKEMMQARRQFLEANHYRLMRENIVKLLTVHLPENSKKMLDIGCGEGYYTSSFTALSASHPSLEVHGLDISKVAVRYAAKRYPDCHFCVASSHRLPFADQSLDAMVRIYAPCKAEEIVRTLKPGAILLTVTPAPRHLYQLKALIYDDVRLHDTQPEVLPGMSLVQEERLHYTMSLNGSEATALMQMTPFAWKTSDAVWQHLAQQHAFSCEADFTLRVYQKSATVDDSEQDNCN
ncbi:23S rRNA (guanine(745)-N(1))-methyltransferase [Photobacterium sp. WH77]|uniref:23S rRNA (guanine(745)-N(1))-methyltransferase n=1 Tax=unclassified Photobacterium TaxID=2628852 RepID=UPI001EDA5312|nr:MULTISPECIES: 23S rRNA (guanine(745)-N(1))-methyltransferase [unclassified Photobacterium]MCG2835668.1 23S rRNA (guanine(745)-N(1))-methyltransferase [Photobacterium sp. WH77]MCG2843281.1 23S rRNA (guanine(745)-N(1))-methyltransferase [Photobacterium sp. WH80]